MSDRTVGRAAPMELDQFQKCNLFAHKHHWPCMANVDLAGMVSADYLKLYVHIYLVSYSSNTG